MRRCKRHLARKIAEIHKLLCNSEPLQRPTPCTSKIEETTTNNQKTVVAEPAPKKRAVKVTSRQKENNHTNNLEAKFATRLTKLELLITANIAAALKQTMETYKAENMNRFAYIERILQPIVSYPTFAPLFVQPRLNQGTPCSPTQS